MEFFVEQAVLDAGVKIVFAAVCGLDNHGEDPEWAAYRDKRLEELFEAYAELDVHADPILEGFNILHVETADLPGRGRAEGLALPGLRP